MTPWSAGPTPRYRPRADRPPRVNLAPRFRPRAAVLVTVLLLSAPAVARGQADTLLVDMILATTSQHVVVEAVLTTPDSTLLLPARDVAALLGLDAPPTAWTTVAELRRRFPPIEVAWYPRELRVVVDDPLGVLPATRRLTEQRQRQARGTSYVSRSGPFFSVVADDRGESLTDVGYAYRGRFAVTGRHSSTLGAAWAVSLAPTPAVFVSYAGGDRSPPTASARVAYKGAWVFTTWTPAAWSTDALIQVGRLSFFGSSRNAFAVTINAAPVGVQLGRTGQRTTARVTWGPLMPSPFSVPVVP